MMIGGLYVFSYAMTALLIRRVVARKISAAFTWVVMLILMGLGCSIPFLFILLFYSEWHYETHQRWLVSIPAVGMAEATRTDVLGRSDPFFLTVVAIWAAAVAVLNVPWFIRQVRAFRRYQSVLASDGRAVQLTAQQAATTKTM